MTFEGIVLPFEKQTPEGSRILDEVERFIRRFIVLSEAQYAAVALWCAHTYVFHVGIWTPYLAITSAEKRCGKSRLMEVVSYLVRCPWNTSGATAASLFRQIDANQPTLLLDEADALFKADRETAEAIRGVLNSGAHHRGSFSRVVGKGTAMATKNFRTFCPKSIAGIGTLPDTVADRSLHIRLQRKLPNQKVERLREREIGREAEALRLRLEKWTTGEIPTLRDARPELPEELNDRQQDGAEILLAIADAAGGDWPAKARHVLLELYTGESAQDDSAGVQLLRDIQGIFEECNLDKITSAELIDQLKSIESSPWGEWNHGKGLTPHGLGRILKRFGITSGSIRVGDSTPKGYVLERFADAFSRFLPAPLLSPGFQSATPPQCSIHAGPSHSLGTQQSLGVADQKSEASPLFTRVVADVADRDAKLVDFASPLRAPAKSGDQRKALPSCMKCGSFYVLYTQAGYACETCGVVQTLN